MIEVQDYAVRIPWHRALWHWVAGLFSDRVYQATAAELDLQNEVARLRAAVAQRDQDVLNLKADKQILEAALRANIEELKVMALVNEHGQAYLKAQIATLGLVPLQAQQMGPPQQYR